MARVGRASLFQVRSTLLRGKHPRSAAANCHRIGKFSPEIRKEVELIKRFLMHMF